MANPEPDDWYIVGQNTSFQSILFIDDTSIQRPVQQEVFEPLGADRKTISRGKTLGDEGTLQCVFPSDYYSTAISLLDYLSEYAGPHTLYSPFGDEWKVEIGTIVRKPMPAGHLTVTIPWTEVE